MAFSEHDLPWNLTLYLKLANLCRNGFNPKGYGGAKARVANNGNKAACHAATKQKRLLLKFFRKIKGLCSILKSLP